MDYKEKYEMALERAKNLYKDAIDMGETIRAKQCEIIFPELAESEDERIRKGIIYGMNALKEQKRATFATIPIDNAIAWLEKQGEQKPIIWSEEDERNMQNIDSVIFYDNSLPEDTCMRLRNWLKFVKQRIGG